MNFENIFLNKKELKLFKLLCRKKSVKVNKTDLHAPELSTLRIYKFINEDWLRTEDDDIYLGTVSITKTGIDYFEYLTKAKRKDKFRFWFPLILSNCIAIAALVVAILAYIKQ